MRSNEIAKLAGVSVRTLRHYHSLGLLAEPERSANGYRDYGAGDLARLLRIKRLASLGFPLSQVGGIIDGIDGEPPQSGGEPAACPAQSALDELDRELQLQIEALERQREIVAQLKRERLSPDVPVRFGRVLQRLQRFESVHLPSDSDRTALMLAGHLYTDSEMSELERVVDALEDESVAARLAEIDRRCVALAPDASQAERDAIVEDALVVLHPLFAQFDACNWAGEETERDRLLDEAANEGLNDAQRDVIARIEEAIARMFSATS